MNNLMSKDNMRSMMGREKILKALISGIAIGILSYIFLFSNHIILALFTTGVVIVFLIFGPEKSQKRDEEKTRTYILDVESSDIVAFQELPTYSRKELKPKSQANLLNSDEERVIQEADIGKTTHLIWHIDQAGLKKWSVAKIGPSQTNTTGPKIPLRQILQQLFA